MKKETVDTLQEYLLNELNKAHSELMSAQEKYNKLSEIYYLFKDEMDEEGFVNYGMHDWRKNGELE